MAGSLEFIKSATGSSVSSLDVTNCFSDNYDVYMISISKINGLQSSGNRVLRLRLLDSTSTVIDQTEYDYAVLDLRSYDTYTEQKSTTSTAFDRIMIYGSGDVEGGATIYVYNPYDSSSYTFGTYQSSGLVEASDRGFGTKGIAVHHNAEQITGINFTPNADSFDLTVKVYGVK